MRLGPLFILWALGLGGCAHAERAADSKYAEMGDTIGKIQAAQDRDNQSSGLMEVSAGEQKGSRPAPARSAQTPVRAVQLGEDDDRRESDDPKDPSARPEIRLQGT